MKPRIKLFDPANMDERQRKIYESIISGPRGRLVGPLRAVLMVPELAERWSKFGEYLRYSAAIGQRGTELAILVTARRWNSHVEWEIHSEEARRVGISDEIIDAIGAAEPPFLSDSADRAVYEFARQLLESGNVDVDVHTAVVDEWGEPGVIELTAVIGYYSMVSMMLSAQGIPTPSNEPALEARGPEGALTRLPKAQDVALEQHTPRSSS